jgi:hypothetical protein
MFRGGSSTYSSQRASHQSNDRRLSLFNTVSPKKLIASSTCHTFSVFLPVIIRLIRTTWTSLTIS